MANDIIAFLYNCEHTSKNDCLIDNCKYANICSLRLITEDLFNMFYTEGEN